MGGEKISDFRNLLPAYTGRDSKGKQGLWRGHGLIPPGDLSASEHPWQFLFAYIFMSFLFVYENFIEYKPHAEK